MLLNIFFSFLLMLVASPDQNSKNELTLKVENIKNPDGVIRVLVFKGQEGFPDQPEYAIQNASIKITNNSAVHTFRNLPDGTYAISLFHDSRNTGKLRTNALGIPKDGYGFSNNAMGMIGPPSFEKAAFTLSKEAKHITIKLK
ncbi:DUF2141 domain-containing protein [Belliella marina]|uniref:DUF2141 domain-containing protein n=1 Tax=Belliella marina TaxID=1644146 RepID=A0ABW4VM97_9BACT